MKYYSTPQISTSWKSDRIIANQIKKPHKARAVRKPYLYAQYREKNSLAA